MYVGRWAWMRNLSNGGELDLRPNLSECLLGFTTTQARANEAELLQNAGQEKGRAGSGTTTEEIAGRQVGVVERVGIGLR